MQVSIITKYINVKKSSCLQSPKYINEYILKIKIKQAQQKPVTSELQRIDCNGGIPEQKLLFGLTYN